MGIEQLPDEILFLSKSAEFQARFSAKGVAEICAVVEEGYRLYDLMTIRRPKDILDYVVVTVDQGWDLLHEHFHLDYDAKTRLKRREPLSFEVFTACIQNSDFQDKAGNVWYDFAHGQDFHRFLCGHLATVQQMQRRVRELSDPLVKYELTVIDEYRHPVDKAYCDSGTRNCVKDGPLSIDLAYPKSFYRFVEKLFALPEIGSISYRGDADYRLLKIACTERLRRHSNIDEVGVQKGFVINVLDGTDRWTNACGSFNPDDGYRWTYPHAPAWMFWIVFWIEGLGRERDVIIDAPRPMRQQLSWLLSEGFLWKVAVSLVEPNLAVRGYQWFYHEDGFAVGVHTADRCLCELVTNIFGR